MHDAFSLIFWEGDSSLEFQLLEFDHIDWKVFGTPPPGMSLAVFHDKCFKMFFFSGGGGIFKRRHRSILGGKRSIELMMREKS